MGRFIHRAGWPASRAHPGYHLGQRWGRWWVWIGPYVIGDLRRF